MIHSIVFSPDGVSTAYLYNDIALGLVENGFDVVVLTTTPHYNLIESEPDKQPISKKIFCNLGNLPEKGFQLFFLKNAVGGVLRVIYVSCHLLLFWKNVLSS